MDLLGALLVNRRRWLVDLRDNDFRNGFAFVVGCDLFATKPTRSPNLANRPQQNAAESVETTEKK